MSAMTNHYCAPHFESLAGIVHGFGTARVGVEEHCASLGLQGMRIVRTHQIHSADVVAIDHDTGDHMLNADAFITNAPYVVCYVRTADCVPILVADAARGVVGAIHAGWRGTAADVAGATIARMHTLYGTDPCDVRAAIGPAICSACYEVGEEVISSFRAMGMPVDRWVVSGQVQGGVHLDLKRANHDLLLRAGVPASAIKVVPHCTRCGGEVFASHRRAPHLPDRQVSFVLINP